VSASNVHNAAASPIGRMKKIHVANTLDCSVVAVGIMDKAHVPNVLNRGMETVRTVDKFHSVTRIIIKNTHTLLLVSAISDLYLPCPL
jgi:hypothetical protein